MALTHKNHPHIVAWTSKGEPLINKIDFDKSVS